MVTVFFCIYFLNAGFAFYGGSVINAFMSQSIGLDRSQLGLGFAALIFCMGLSGPLSGTLIDRIGVRNTLLLGGALTTSGALLMALVASKFWHYMVFFGLIIGIGAPLGGMYPVQAGVTFWFARHKALALSIVLCATGIGALIATPAVNWVIQSLGGDWNKAWLLVAAACALAMLASALGVIDRPEDLGQLPDGIEAEASRDGRTARQIPRVYQSSDPWTASQAIRTRAFWYLVLAGIALSAPYNLGIAHSVVHFKDMGMSNELASAAVGSVVMWSIVGRLAGGVLADRIDARLPCCVGLLLVAVATLIISRADTPVDVHLYTLFMGVGFGISYVCVVTILGNYFGANAFSKVIGLLGAFASLSGGIAPYIGGRVYDAMGSYTWAFSGLTFLTMTGALMVLSVRPPQFYGHPQSAGIDTS